MVPPLSHLRLSVRIPERPVPRISAIADTRESVSLWCIVRGKIPCPDGVVIGYASGPIFELPVLAAPLA